MVLGNGKPIFREDDPTYKRLKADWFSIFEKAYLPKTGIRVSELDPLMLASFRLSKYIKRYLASEGVDTSYYFYRMPELPDALRKARDLLQTKGVVSLFAEAEALEAVSRAVYKFLKDNNKLFEPDGP